MKTKRIIACIISCILFMMCVPFTATAKVIEPEVVKTEKWTTSYYIDDDESTLYPYVDCQADIYSDGTVKCYFWNSHEWDGFATVNHYITIVNTMPYPDDSRWYAFSKGEEYKEYNKSYKPLSTGYSAPHEIPEPYVADYSYFENHDFSFYPKEYKYSHNQWVWGEMWCNSNKNVSMYMFDDTTTNHGTVEYFTWHDALPKMNDNKTELIFTPLTDPTGTYQFHILGHDITITPELLSGNIVSTPSTNGYQEITYNNGTSAIQIKTDIDISGIQNYIDKLEAENATLRQENTELKNRINLLSTGTYGDVNGDNAVDIQDAQIILAYYTQKDVAMMDVPDLVTFGLNFGKE